jgi:hypothetical protein
MAKRSNSVTGLFGMINDENKVPPVLEECVDFLVDHASTKNLFFEGGNETRLQNLRDEIMRGRAKEVPETEDPHTVAQLFLQWFKVAKSPLIPSSLSLKLYAASLKSTTDLVKMFKEIVEFLTPARRGILKRTLRVLHVICLHGESADKDGIIAKELSKLFRPFLLDLGDDEARNKVGEQVVLQAIINYKELFKYRTASAPPRVIVRHDTEPTPPNPELEKAMAEGSQVSPRRTKKFSAEDVKFYLARKFNEIFAKGVSSPHPWWKNVLVYTPDSLNLLVNSWKEQEEVAKLIEKEQKSPIIEEHIEKEPGSAKAEKKLPDNALEWVTEEVVGDYDADYFLKKQQEEEEQRKREQDERRKKANEEFERKQREKEEEEKKKLEAKRIEEEKKKELRRIAKEQAEKIVELEQAEKKKKHEEEWKKREEELVRQREEYKKLHPDEDLNEEYEEVITVVKKVPKKSSHPTSPRDPSGNTDSEAGNKSSPRN